MAVIDNEVTVYITATGEIMGTYSKNSFDTDFLQAGEAYIEEEWFASTHYLPGGVGTERPIASWSKTTITADGVDFATITGLPSTTRIVATANEIGSSFEEVNTLAPDGILNFTCNYPATITTQVINIFPYLDLLQDIEAV